MIVIEICAIVIVAAGLINRIGSVVLDVLTWRRYKRLYPAVTYLTWRAKRRR